MGKILSWGKCQIAAIPLENTGAEITDAIVFDYPVEGTASLETAQGDKSEAKVEGGQVMASRYNANTYDFKFEIRLHSAETELPLAGNDGVIPGEFKIEILPLENEAAPVIYINRSSANVQVSYDSAGGIIAAYTFSSMAVTDGKQITIINRSYPTYAQVMANLAVLSTAQTFQLKEYETSSGKLLCVLSNDGQYCLGEISYPNSLDDLCESITLGEYIESCGHNVSSQGSGTIYSIPTNDIFEITADKTIPHSYDYHVTPLSMKLTFKLK